MQNVYHKQLLFVIIGIFLYIATSLMPIDILISPKLLFWIHSLLIIVLISLFFTPSYAGTNRWFTIGNFTLQPSEFIKITSILILALGLIKKDKTTILIAFVPLIFIFLQPDLGMTLTIATTLVTMLFLSLLITKPKISYSVFTLAFLDFISIITLLILPTKIALILILFYILITVIKYPSSIKLILIQTLGFLISLATIIGLYKSPLLQPYQKARLEPYVSILEQKDFTKLLEPTIENFHTKQAKIAIGSGGITGKGIENTTQSRLRFLPEAHTDFIYATISEITGLIGAITIIILYLILIARLLIMAYQSSKNDLFAYFVITAVTILIVIEIVIGLGVNLALFPTKGSPLPFLSYGGSSLLTHSILLGITSNLYYNTVIAPKQG